MKTVLFADDDKGFREICKRILEDEGYRIVLARDGIEAVETVKAERPDLAILDIHMPRKGGMDAAELIYAIDPSIPIILYTANDDTATRDPRARFAAACVEKSSDFTEMAMAVGRLLSLGQQMRFISLRIKSALRKSLASTTKNCVVSSYYHVSLTVSNRYSLIIPLLLSFSLFPFQGMELFRRHGLGPQIAEDDFVLAVVEFPAQEHLILVVGFDGFAIVCEVRVIGIYMC